MEVQIGTAIAIATAVFTAGGAWVTVRNTTLRLEMQREKDAELAKKESEKLEARVSERLKEYADKKDDQARRIGKVEGRVSVLEGRSAMLEDLRTAIIGEAPPPRRRSTNAGGIPRVPADEEESGA